MKELALRIKITKMLDLSDSERDLVQYKGIFFLCVYVFLFFVVVDFC